VPSTAASSCRTQGFASKTYAILQTPPRQRYLHHPTSSKSSQPTLVFCQHQGPCWCGSCMQRALGSAANTISNPANTPHTNAGASSTPRAQALSVWQLRQRLCALRHSSEGMSCASNPHGRVECKRSDSYTKHTVHKHYTQPARQPAQANPRCLDQTILAAVNS
jgi:hypothetical protein